MFGLFFGGSGEKSLDLGVTHEACRGCGGTCRLSVNYRYIHAYWIFRAITKRQYLAVCQLCGRRWELDTAPASVSDAIPFMDRMGCAVGIGVAAAIAILVWRFMILNAPP